MKQLFTISGRYAATEDVSITPQTSGLSWNTRLQGFLICLISAILLGIAASIVYFLGANLSGFAILYTLANLAAIGSTFFLTGPLTQLKKMFDSSRFIATIVFLLCVILTLISALVWKISVLVLLFIILQFFALIWYTLSYIPFARFSNSSDDELMSINGSHRNSLVVIPFLQKRLRRITSIGLQNLTVIDRHFSIYFTLHRFDSNEFSSKFFTSESLLNERNPEWSNLKFPTDAQCLQEFRIYFWLKISENSRLFLHYDVYLDKSLLPDAQFDLSRSNSFWFEMFGHRFSDASNDNSTFPSIDSSRLKFVKSYNRSSILRIFNLIEAIRKEENSTSKCLRDVEIFLEKKNEIISKLAERETRRIRIKNLRQSLTNQMSINRQQLICLRENEKVLRERKNLLEFYRSRLILQRESIDELFGYVEQSRSDLHQLEQMIEQRRKDLLKDISNFIYPIESNEEDQWRIVQAKLPPANDKIYQNSSIRDKEIAGALVFSSHLVLLISNIIDLPLRYPIDYSTDGTIRIYDFTLEIQQFLLDPSSNDPNAFRYAFYLLNRNIGQILFHCRIPTRRVDFRRTLENLKTFFEHFVQL